MKVYNVCIVHAVSSHPRKEHLLWFLYFVINRVLSWLSRNLICICIKKGVRLRHFHPLTCNALNPPPLTRIYSTLQTEQLIWENRPISLNMVALDLDACLERLYKKQLLAECVLKEICERTKELLTRESNVIHVRAPVTVVGDIHGYVTLIKQYSIYVGTQEGFVLANIMIW